MDRLKFEKLVARAVGQLPLEFREKLENVAIIVEDRPSPELLDQMEIPPGDTLFGLYQGTPLTERGFQPPLNPDQIWIFQEPIEAECENDAQIVEEIEITIMHEIAHFFGLDDDYLEDLGY